jgi:hypothetical protein
MRFLSLTLKPLRTSIQMMDAGSWDLYLWALGVSHFMGDVRHGDTSALFSACADVTYRTASADGGELILYDFYGGESHGSGRPSR